ncbi:prominin-1-A-like isoform X6 [Lineus longissimus]|uniref:prominin-1-A-like isoform X6 n=1 Tax=Lineus longissimus TaxID=88925 RepID=UPI00315DAC8C
MAAKDTMDQCSFVLKTFVLVGILFVGSCVHYADAVSDGTNSSSAATGSGAQGDEDLSPLEKGTQPLFFVTNFFLNSILQPNTSGIPINFAVVFGNGTGTVDLFAVLTTAETEWSKYVMHYLGFLICFALGIIFIIVMPIVGLCFCCCRLCGRCGARPNPMDSKHAKCKRVTFGTFLFIVTTFMLAATVCAFVTNDLIHKQASDDDNGFVGSVSSNIEGVEQYVSNTATELKTTVLNKFDETKAKIIADVKSISTKVQNDIGQLTNAGPLLDNATKLAEDVTTLRKGLEVTRDLTSKLITDAKTLETQLGNVRTDVKGALGACSTSLCNTVSTETDKLKVNIEFTKVNQTLANVDGVIQKLKDIEGKNITAEINKGKADYNEISANISKSVQSYINQSETAINDIKGNIEQQLTKMSDMLSDMTKQLETARQTVEKFKPEVKKYGDYVMYGGIALSCILLLVVLLNFLGLMFGACGERPYEDARACNKGVGADFLMAGVGFTFLFCWLLMLMTMILFIIGGPVETEVCRHLVDPINSSQIEQIDEFLNLGQYIFPGKNTELSVQEVLKKCSEDAAIYSALKLKNLLDVSKIIDDAMKTVDQEVDKIAAQIKNVKIDNIVLLPPDADKLLTDVVNSDYSTINFQDSLDELKKQLLSISLSTYITALEGVKGEPGVDQAKIQTSITTLNDLSKDSGLIKTMNTDIDALKKQMTDLSSANIQTSAGDLKTGLENAQLNINTNFGTLIAKAANSTAVSIKQNARVLGNQLVYELENNIGKCKPLYDSLMGLINTTCKKTLNPLNGFWFAFGWCLFFFIPSLIFSVKLAGLYRKTEKYSAKEFDDADANNYHGIYPGDNIPLNEPDTYTYSAHIPARVLQMRNNPKHYRDGRGLQNTGYERDSNGPGRSDQRNANPAHNPDYNPDHRGGYGDGGSSRAGQGYPDDYHPHSGPPAYSAPSPPHWQNNRYYGHGGGNGY